MTTESLTLQLESRSVVGKKVKQLRRQGMTPVHLYGRATEPLSLQGDSAVVRRVIVQAGKTVPVTVSIMGERNSRFVFVREVQRHPLSESLLHVDLYQVPMTEVMQAEVPIYLVGEAPAVRLLNGVLIQALHAIPVECLPLDVPQNVELDISGLDDFEKALHVSDIHLGEKVTILTDPEEVIARVNAPRVVEEEVPAVPVAEKALEVEPGEEPAEED